MTRVTLDITEEQQRQLESQAALHQQTVEEYLLACALPLAECNFPLPHDYEAGMTLDDMLRKRVDAAKDGEFSDRSAMDIFKDVQQIIHENKAT